MTKASLFVNELELNVKLGWSAEERAQLQTVKVSFEIHFNDPPKACTSDRLEDTVCYDSLIQTVKSKMSPREFHLIEHLANEIYQHTKSLLPANAVLKVLLTKKPAIPDLKKGVTFCYGD